MAVTLEQVIRQIDRDEPDYEQAARLGPEALPHLRQLVDGTDPGLASKAASLAGVINGDESPAVLELAARHRDPIVRVAAAASAKYLTTVSTSLASTFLDDPDPGVRKWVLRTLDARQPKGIKDRVERIMIYDPDASLRDLARKIIDKLY